jgi:hypothetical protein
MIKVSIYSSMHFPRGLCRTIKENTSEAELVASLETLVQGQGSRARANGVEMRVSQDTECLGWMHLGTNHGLLHGVDSFIIWSLRNTYKALSSTHSLEESDQGVRSWRRSLAFMRAELTSMRLLR